MRDIYIDKFYKLEETLGIARHIISESAYTMDAKNSQMLFNALKL